MVSQLDALDQLNGQYADMCNTFEKYCASFFATQSEIHEFIDKIQTPVGPVSGTNPSEKRDHNRKSGDSAQPLVSSNISSHQLEKNVSQVDGSDVTGKSENISHNSHNSKFTDNTFDIQHESHNSLKLETSNMDKSIPVKMSMKNSSEKRSHRGAFPRDQMKNVCFHCRKHGHFANECPYLCPPSRTDKDSNWRHSMKQRNVHDSKNGNRHFNLSPAQNSIDKHNDTNDTNIGSVTPDVIAIRTVGDALHGDNTDMNSVPLGVNEMQSVAYHVGSDIRELVEDMVDLIVDYHVQESFVKCRGEDLAVVHHADSVINLDDDESIVSYSDDESNDGDRHYQYSDGVCLQFEISNDVRHHTKTLSENDTTISGKFSTCLADINILSNAMGDGDLSNNYHHVLFSDGANDFGDLCHNQMDANFVTLVVLLSSTFLQCLQAINHGVNGVGFAKTYLCTKLFYLKEIRHRKEIYQLNS